MKARLLWLLHAHLPWVRHPEHARFYEEDWFFEALERSYLPLLEVLEGWARDEVRATLILSLSPPLVAMLRDPLLQARFRAHLDRRSALWGEERRRVPSAWSEGELKRVASVRRLYERIDGDPVSAFAAHARAGRLELWTTAITHAFLPAFASRPGFVRRQIRLGLDAHRRVFESEPAGLWLPECGWFEGLDPILAAEEVRHTVLEGEGLRRGTPSPGWGPWRVAESPSGVRLLGRHPRIARQVWSRELGFPGDGRYLDFHADASAHRSPEELKAFLLADGAKVPLRLCHHRVTDRRSPRKAAYDPKMAARAALEHAEVLICDLERELSAFPRGSGRAPEIVAPFDAELFGHWWREGPAFLDALARGAQGRVELVGTEGLDDAPRERVRPAPSTWGRGSDASVWVSPETARLWGPILDAVDALERRPAPGTAARRARAQQHREVLLAASSDWPFLMRMGTATEYAESRVFAHLEAAERLDFLSSGLERDPGYVSAREARLGAFLEALSEGGSPAA